MFVMVDIASCYSVRACQNVEGVSAACTCMCCCVCAIGAEMMVGSICVVVAPIEFSKCTSCRAHELSCFHYRFVLKVKAGNWTQQTGTRLAQLTKANEYTIVLNN